MPILKGNLHTHSRWSDGHLEPAEVAARYRDLGYHFLAFTDHRCFLGPDGEHAYWAGLPPSDDSLVILRGVEEEPPEIGGRHLGVIRGHEEQLRILNHPSEYGLSVEETAAAVAAVRADAIEVTCHGRYLEPYDTDRIGVPKVATDDAHFGYEIGVAWIEVESRRDPDAILRAIKAGDFESVIQGRWRSNQRPRAERSQT